MNQLRYYSNVVLLVIASFLIYSCGPMSGVLDTPVADTPSITATHELPTATYTPLIPSDTPIPPVRTFSVEESMDLLKQANIILSWESEEPVKGYLNTDPAYQKLASLCINLLHGKQLIDPVPLDVINAKYKEQFGVALAENLSPDKYDDVEILKIAIYNAWKERYYSDDPQVSFDGILKSR